MELKKKICKFCNEEKICHEFSMVARSCDGLSSKCKVCTKKYKDEFTKKHGISGSGYSWKGKMSL